MSVMNPRRLRELERDLIEASPMGVVPVPRDELATLIQAYRGRYTCSVCSCAEVVDEPG